jgi:hypothetical protein
VRKGIILYVLFFLTVSVLVNCRKSYTPPEINVNHMFLSVDGIINTSSGNVSTFRLTRSQKLTDTVPIPERGAAVTIKDGTGASYPLTDTGSNGVYVSNPLTLNPYQHYELSIVTADGNQYSSDPVTPKLTPSIDTLNWTLGFDSAANIQAVNIYVNTHDPSNKTRFYRWDFIETWTHEPIYRTFYLIKQDTNIVYSDSTEHNWHCWNSAGSTNILLGSSSGLSADIISQAPITRIYQNDPRLDVKYSILVRQYALDDSAYDYWLQVQKQSQTLGGLFDVIPAQLVGNMHSLSNPSEPVYGYVSASTVQQQRIFIGNGDLPGWKSTPAQTCTKTEFVTDPDLYQSPTHYYNPDPNFTFFEYGYDPHFGDIQILITPACLDCTYQGGTTVKPPFWQ